MKKNETKKPNIINDGGKNKIPKIIELLQTSLSYRDYSNLKKELNISTSRFSRLKKSGILTFGELSKLLPLLYKRFSISALIPEPKEFVVLYEQNHLTLEEVEKLQNLRS